MRILQTLFILIVIALPFLFGTCSTYNPNSKDTNNKTSKSDLVRSAPYLQTGFYYLSKDGKSGVKIKKDHSEEEYVLNPTPFTSTKNIISNRLETIQLTNGQGTNLCLTFNADGQKELENGSAEALNQRIAIVIAGHLLYVVPVNHPITDSEMCIILIGYTDDEMQNMQKKVNAKK